MSASGLFDGADRSFSQLTSGAQGQAVLGLPYLKGRLNYHPYLAMSIDPLSASSAIISPSVVRQIAFCHAEFSVDEA